MCPKARALLAKHRVGTPPRGRIRLFECIRTQMTKGSPEEYNAAETGSSQPAQKPQTGEPHERKPLYRIRCPQEKHQLLRESRRRDHTRRGHTAGQARDPAL